MAKQGFYGREYVKTKDGDYDYLGQVNRLHNLRQWDRDETVMLRPQKSISLDEMNERWKAYDWLVADDKHWEAQVIKHVDEEAQKKRDAERNEKEIVHTNMPHKRLNKMLRMTRNW